MLRIPILVAAWVYMQHLVSLCGSILTVHTSSTDWILPPNVSIFSHMLGLWINSEPKKALKFTFGSCYLWFCWQPARYSDLFAILLYRHGSKLLVSLSLLDLPTHQPAWVMAASWFGEIARLWGARLMGLIGNWITYAAFVFFWKVRQMEFCLPQCGGNWQLSLLQSMVTFVLREDQKALAFAVNIATGLQSEWH